MEAEVEVEEEVAEEEAAAEEDAEAAVEEDAGAGAVVGAPDGAAGPAVEVPAPVAPAPPVPRAGPRAAAPGGLWAAASVEGQGVSDARMAIAQQQKELAEQSRRLSMDMHNANRRRQRLMDKARGLSDADLVEIVRERAIEEEQRKAKKAKKTCKAKSKAGRPRATVARWRWLRNSGHTLCASVRSMENHGRITVWNSSPFFGVSLFVRGLPMIRRSVLLHIACTRRRVPAQGARLPGA